MFRLRSKSGDESVFRTPEEIRSALLSGFVTPDAQIWDAELKGWVPLIEHALYQQIAASPGGRKSGAVKAPPTTPAAPKAPPKLVIKRPGATTAIPAAKPTVPPEPVTPPSAPPPAPPAPPKAAASEEIPDLELIDLDLAPEPAAPAPAETAPPAPPKRPTPTPLSSTPEPPARVSTPRVSAPKGTVPEPTPDEAPVPMQHTAEAVATGGSKAGLFIAAAVVLAAAGGGYFYVHGRAPAAAPADSAVPPPVVHVAATDTARDTTTHAVVDTTHHDTTTSAAPATTVAVAHADTAHKPVATPPAADTATATGGIEPVPFAPLVERGATSWNARPLPPAPLSIPALELVRSRYAAAQARAQQQFEATLSVAEFADMFDPAKAARGDARQAAFDAVDAARGALRDFRRKQAALDFAYTDSLRQALPPGSDEPDLRTFGPLLRETPAQAALTDSLVSELVDMYGLLVSEAGGYTLKNGALLWKDADNATQYRGDQERLTAQLARIRTRSPADVPPAMAAILRGIGLPR